MDIERLSARLISELRRYHGLPEGLLHTLQHCSSQQYLNLLAELALDPRFTEIIYATNESVFVDVSSRWLQLSQSKSLLALAAYARVLPSAPHLADHAASLLEQPHGSIKALCTRDFTALCEVPERDLETLLLAIVRLLMFDDERFATCFPPAPFIMLLSHGLRHIRYLAIRLLCLYLHASDAALEAMVKARLGEVEVAGPWEGKTIDYTFFTLWEHRRLATLDGICKMYRHDMIHDSIIVQHSSTNRVLQSEDLHRTTASLGNTLIPTVAMHGRVASTLISTATTQRNLRALAEGINTGRPILVAGLSGSGKTKLVNETASLTGNSSSMITLHLNQQTDAKLLIGLYTSTKYPGSFAWRPGVLTTAVTEGRWVLVEDLDRAPMEVISILLPLIERRELHIPNQENRVLAAPGFKIIATLRTFKNARGAEINPAAGMIGLRHWYQVSFQASTHAELSRMVSSLFPLVHPHLPQMMNVYTALTDLQHTNVHARLIGPSDFLRWSRRVQVLLEEASITSSLERISESVQENMFLEAVDSFAGSIPHGQIKGHAIRLIAQALHVPAQLMEHSLEIRKPAYVKTKASVRIGRACFKSSKSALLTRTPSSIRHPTFALTNHVLRVLESVAVGVQLSEPCLLVGETGAGKTAIVQQLALILNAKLVVVNLSQQSEAGDLLGGYKPVNPRSIAVPMKDEFHELLQSTFPSRQNQKFLDTVAKAIAKGRWNRALTLWEEALRTIRPIFSTAEFNKNEPNQKKRKLHSHHEDLRTRWNRFADELENFRVRLSSDSRGVAFSFVEGTIVNAVRNGDWVLLDEINLTSPDTLESLADLFSSYHDGDRSLLLSEKGDIERVYAHKDFRIFGAMNPATDIGKRDLPPSIRSRFTEIFVDAPDKVLADLVSVVNAYLRSFSHSDMRAASDAAILYLDIKKLAEANRLIDGSSQKPHFSLRTLTRTLMYVTDIAPVYGLRRALYEGFSMSFITVLDAVSRSLVLPLIEKRILGSQSNRKGILHQTIRSPEDGRPYVRFRQYWVKQGTCPVEEQPHYILTPFVEQNLQNLVRATSTRRFPVLLQGPTSSGKTSLIEYLAKISGNKYVRVNNHEHTDLQEYLGTYISDLNGQLIYQDGVLVKALKEGHWIVLDELNLAPTDVLEALNRLLDDNRELLVPETQQVIRPHEDFMLFATQNPPGTYGGRKVLSRAFRNRFLELHFDEIPEGELETILRERSQIAPSSCTQIVAVYKNLSTLRQSDRLFEQRNSFATLRDLFRWALRNADDRTQLAINGFHLLAERVRNQTERASVKMVIENVMKVNIDEDQIYGPQSHYAANTISKERGLGITWTKSARRVYVLVMQALKNNEPVLLVGETGSGKTMICQVVAETMKKQLHTVNAHQNMETSDLIGAQRPLRNRALAHELLVKALTNALQSCGAYKEEFGNDLSTLTAAYDQLSKQPSGIPEEIRLSVKECRARTSVLFEWSDGSLVTSMKNGHHFLLDEISLADDSVLERLNSVLEPQRTLYLAERGNVDALVVASDGFQFLATMNPGGDYGKRELSPALRNRFTEIWVPLSSNKEEVVQIVKARLKSNRLVFAKPMVDFAEWFASTYNFSSSNIAIRDLICWTDFMNHFRDSDLPSAILDGASMVYLDRLGANPAAKFSVAEENVSQQRRVCEAKLMDLFGMDIGSLQSTRPELKEDEHSMSLGGFQYAKSSLPSSNLQYSLRAPTALRNSTRIFRALQVGKPILLEGSPGVGKTTLVSVIADLIGKPLTRMNLSDQTDLMDLFGSDEPIEGAEAGHFAWRDAPFLRAMQKGDWVLLDEMNLASQTVLEGLNACFDHRGEIYISELDKTFSRHPDFFAFAAQNPHHQGGGRKGLPESFVNRFTVVFADALTQEDLQVICSTSFPRCEPSLSKHIIDCVNHVTLQLQRNPRLGSQGGPWEINLRDALRWLELCSQRRVKICPSDPSDYQLVSLSQRFRTPEDRDAVTDLIKMHFTDHDRVRSYSIAKENHQIVIGMGFLPRDETLRPSRRGEYYQYLNLRHAESVMLCIEKSWPVLLVGQAGAGKTSLILHLAELAGADVVELCLNPETDTIDLVGGYEQFDSQRGLTNLVGRLRDYIHKALVQQLASGAQPDATFLNLVSWLATTASTQDLVPLLQAMIINFPSSQYSDFLKEYQAIVARSSITNSARFEWVDSSLVRALIQGKWLILDNANLCNPSVLDRLNSLLEPGGSLSINEYRNLDGSARTIKPHPAFRIFMTMDPRHGELSRAMRNRSVELFVPFEDPLVSLMPPLLNPAIEPSISRFASIQRLRFENNDALSLLMLLICFDNLTFADFNRIQRWQSQVLNGLEHIPESVAILFSSIVEIYNQLFCYDGTTMKAIKQIYWSVQQNGGTEGNTVAPQTINPYNNPSLLRLTAHELSPFRNLQILGQQFETLIEIYLYGNKLAKVAEVANNESLNQMSQLERSFTSNVDSTRPILAFLQGMGLFMRKLVDGGGLDGAQNIGDRKSMLSYVAEVLRYLEDILDLTQNPLCDESNLRIYQIIGRSLSSRLQVSKSIGRLTAALANELECSLTAINSHWQLYSGMEMESLWKAFRPQTAITISQLDLILEIESLAEQFDKIRWSSKASLTDLISTRNLLLRIFENSGNLQQPLQGPSMVKTSFDVLMQKSSPLLATDEPYFIQQFDTLRQYERLTPMQHTDMSCKLSLLCGEPTRTCLRLKDSSHAWNSLRRLCDSIGSSLPHNQLSTIRQAFPASTIRQMLGRSGVPLRALDLLKAEISSLAQSTAQMSDLLMSDPLKTLGGLMQIVQEKTVEALQTSLGTWNIQEIKRNVGRLPPRLDGQILEGIVPSDKTSAGYVGPLECERAIESVFSQSKYKYELSSDSRREASLQLASEIIYFFAGFILLYVPDRPYDPAVKSRVEQDRHCKRQNELRNKIAALRNYEKAVSGQTYNNRIQLVERALEALGSCPEGEDLYRPESAEIGALQGDFNNVLRSVILLLPEVKELEKACLNDSHFLPELDARRQDVRITITRLSQAHRAYDDITKPLLAILSGLDAGLSLVIVAAGKPAPAFDVIIHICSNTPFMDAQTSDISSMSFVELQRLRNPALDLRVQFLESAILTKDLGRSPSHEGAHTIVRVFHAFYEEWKARLIHDQDKSAANSSLYRFRGSEAKNEQMEEEGFQEIFPDYDDVQDDGSKVLDMTDHPSRMAQTIARIHSRLFRDPEDPVKQLLAVLGDSSRVIANLWPEPSDQTLSPVLGEHLLSPLILFLDEQKELLCGTSAHEGSYNFYKDENIVEAQKLVSLVQRVEALFSGLQKSWPEHATLTDVLRTSAELLAMRHTEPVAKFLTKTEQLHRYIQEWQTVASKDYSAAALYEQVTQQLISWRRLELSAWARLLDGEDERCMTEADSWWFIAYENIIAAPMSMMDKPEDTQSYARQLIATLQEFLSNTSIGQFSHRLAMLRTFQGHIRLFKEEHPSLHVILDALHNFVNYCKRFEPLVKEQQENGRHILEKEVKEVLLLASWKDTRIEALSESARRSHHKLFKTIREYRSLLARPTDTLLSQSFPMDRDPVPIKNGGFNSIELSYVDGQIIKSWKNRIEGWNAKPDRFKNPWNTAKHMLQITQESPDALDVQEVLENYARELTLHIKALQKETPTSTTKDNADAVKHLKSRKHKLYSDTLKFLRQMGFRTSHGTAMLSQQNSIPAILSTITSFQDIDPEFDVAGAEHEFQNLVNAVPQARECTREHHRDLSHGEVARSIGYLESIVSTVISQRRNISSFSTALMAIREGCQRMAAMWKVNRLDIDYESQHGPSHESNRRKIQCLPTILDTGVIILEKHGKIGGMDTTNVRQSLARWKDTFSDIKQKIRRLPQLPDGLTSSLHAEIHDEILTKFAELHALLSGWCIEYPHTAFIFRQIKPWVTYENESNQVQANGCIKMTISQYDSKISEVLDSMLVAVQRMSEKSANLPESEEEQKWLLHIDTSLAESLKTLHLQGIAQLLDNALSGLKHLDAHHGEDLQIASAISTMALPIVEQFHNVVVSALGRYVKSHVSLCRLGSMLARSLAQIGMHGFCSPDETSATDTGTTEKLEDGTGLGDGGGAEDVSKDIRDDEDLSELAQQGPTDKNRNELDNEEDAINMDYDELEGELGGMSDEAGDLREGSKTDQDDVDEEAGQAGELGEKALDERLWDGEFRENGKEKENDAKSQPTGDAQAAAGSDQQAEDTVKDGEGSKDEAEDKLSQYDAEEPEAVACDDNEAMDSNVQSGQSLELPDGFELEVSDGTQSESDIESNWSAEVSDSHDNTGEDTEMLEGDGDRDIGSRSDASDDTDERKDDGFDEGNSEVKSPVNDDLDSISQELEEKSVLHDRTKDSNKELGDPLPSATQGFGLDNNQENDTHQQEDATTQSKGTQVDLISQANNSIPGELGNRENQMGDSKVNDTTEPFIADDVQRQAFKELGNALEQWHRQQRQIIDSPEDAPAFNDKTSDMSMPNQDVQHIPYDGAEADGQALGTATDDQIKALNDLALESESKSEDPLLPPDCDLEQENGREEDGTEDTERIQRSFNDSTLASKSAELIVNHSHRTSNYSESKPGIEDEEGLDDLDDDLSITHVQPAQIISTKSVEDARHLWAHYENVTRDLSLYLTEQLRLILAPTLATKMRGDFRSGKRLNMKRIIPYIASQYRRDKIWMRRSIPTKRSYQIMLAVDDSRSMGESGSAQLAFETLALVSKSLNMLEAGQICVVGFGDDVIVAHDFDRPLSAEAGAQLLNAFSFQQSNTNVRKLIAESITKFRDARRRGSNAGTDLWQLELIISDGVCEDHESIRQLVRKAQEERIMIVFVIVDGLNAGQSIMDMNEAVFEPDASGGNQLNIRRYLDDFPFPYYLIVGDVKELPGVLAQALRQWFAEVVDSA